LECQGLDNKVVTVGDTGNRSFASRHAPAGTTRKGGIAAAVTLLVFTALIPTLSAEDVQDTVDSGGSGLRVALIQFAVEEDIYDSHGEFFREIHALVHEARTDYGAEFVVFPEYINALALLDNYDALVDRSGGAAVFLEAVTEDAPLPELLSDEAEADTPALRARWAAVARKHQIWILAGTSFVPAADGTVRNRAWLFDPTGELVYYQDKVFLTPVERELLRLTPGRVDRARPFTIENVTFGLTICRDGFFEEWEEPFGEVDAWLEIRANGEVWTPDVRRRFDTAMPERVGETDVETGLSTSLTGSFLDQIWEGPTHVVDEEGMPVYQSSVVNDTTITVISLD
jgi:predicted amidohydrolase